MMVYIQLHDMHAVALGCHLVVISECNVPLLAHYSLLLLSRLRCACSRSPLVSIRRRWDSGAGTPHRDPGPPQTPRYARHLVQGMHVVGDAVYQLNWVENLRNQTHDSISFLLRSPIMHLG